MTDKRKTFLKALGGGFIFGFSTWLQETAFFGYDFMIRSQGTVHYRHEVKAELISKPMRNWHYRLVLFIEIHDIELDGKEEREEFSFI